MLKITLCLIQIPDKHLQAKRELYQQCLEEIKRRPWWKKLLRKIRMFFRRKQIKEYDRLHNNQ
jgi:hypothetical protein